MTDKPINTSIEILGKFYSIRCVEAELPSLQEAAQFLNQKMLEVKESGKAINLERIAIITALNIAHQLIDEHHQKSKTFNKINQRIVQLQDKLDHSINKGVQAEFDYSSDQTPT